MTVGSLLAHRSPRHTEIDACEVGLVCWTRMQAEAGQTLDAIVARKEIERRAGGGLFFWGVGNPPPRDVASLARLGQRVEIVFSIMKGRPRAVDARPPTLLVWRRFVDSDGTVRPLPRHVLVTSRGRDDGRKRTHYALVCRSPASLTLNDHGPFHPEGYRNFGGTGAPVGASQVTVLLRPAADEQRSGLDAAYQVNLRAELTGGLWVKLIDPVVVDDARRPAFERDLTRANLVGWWDFVAEARADPPGTARWEPKAQLRLI